MTETRDRILTATNELFRVHGYNGTSLKEISQAAAATIGSIYHFFPGGKQELATASIAVSGASYQALFEMLADDAGDIASAMTDFFDGAAEVLAATDFLNLCPVGTVAGEVADTDPPIRDAAATAMTGWIEAMAGRLEREGVDRDHALELAATIVATIEGGFILARATRDVTALRATGRHMRDLVTDAVGSVDRVAEHAG